MGENRALRKDNKMKNKLIKHICLVAIGIALYVTLSMTIKIPVIGNISLDLGYIVLAVYCYCFGGKYGAVVGSVGCSFVSIVTSGWFPPGWFLGNLFIGYYCGIAYITDEAYKPAIELQKLLDNNTGNDFRNNKRDFAINIIVTLTAVLVGIVTIKTEVECALYSIPFMVKLPKNIIAGVMDVITMCVGLMIAPKLKRHICKY